MRVLGGLVIAFILLASVVIGWVIVAKFFNASTLQTQVINPKPGVECVVVSASESTSVDCWRSSEKGDL